MLKVIQSPAKYLQGPDASTLFGQYAKNLADSFFVIADDFVMKLAGEKVLNGLHSSTDTTQQSAQVDVTGPFSLFGRTHQAMFGYNDSRTVAWSPQYRCNMVSDDRTSASALGLLLATHPAAAQNPADHSSHATPVASVAAGAALTEGVITRVDARSGKLTIRHGEIANLGMPPMTMVFRVADPALLKDLKVGDAVRFHAENPAGKLTVTAIQKQ